MSRCNEGSRVNDGIGTKNNTVRVNQKKLTCGTHLPHDL